MSANLILLGILVVLNVVNTVANFLNMLHNRKKEKILDEVRKKEESALSKLDKLI